LCRLPNGLYFIVPLADYDLGLNLGTGKLTQSEMRAPDKGEGEMISVMRIRLHTGLIEGVRSTEQGCVAQTGGGTLSRCDFIEV
jgi:hypothetical protein